MRVLVSDTSVLIDLERGDFLEAAFALPWEFAVPDLLYERELRDHGGERLVELGLRVADLEPDEVSRALSYRRRQAALSLADTFALSLAASRGWTLLTGDGRLRDLARLERVTCHGVLWVLDQLHEEAATPPQRLHDGLVSIAAHPRCRLPKRDVAIRLERFKVE
jgi:hypothetical protein